MNVTISNSYDQLSVSVSRRASFSISSDKFVPGDHTAS